MQSKIMAWAYKHLWQSLQGSMLWLLIGEISAVAPTLKCKTVASQIIEQCSRQYGIELEKMSLCSMQQWKALELGEADKYTV